MQSPMAAYSCIANQNKSTPVLSMQRQTRTKPQYRQLGSDSKPFSGSNYPGPMPLSQVLDLEIKEELTELSQRLTSDQFPGFSVETENSEVKLSKQSRDTMIVIRFSVSSSLTEWQAAPEEGQTRDSEEPMFHLVSLPDFQVQMSRGGRTFEISCFFEEPDLDENTGEATPREPEFEIDEIVMYEGEPGDTEFSVSTEFFRDELHTSILEYLADHGIDKEFTKNLVSFATNYERKQYISLMKRLREFVAE